MRKLAPTLLPLLPLLLAVACGPPDAESGPEFNTLPRVDAELNDADPLFEGASILVTLVDEDGEECSLTVEVSFDGGETYAPATLGSSEESDLTRISCTRAGQRFTLVWQSDADIGDDPGDGALLRFTPTDATEQGPPDHLPIDFDMDQRTIHGVYVEHAGATGAQYSYQRMGLAHLEFYSHSVALDGDYLAGADRYEGDGDEVVWEYDVPDPPPDHHFHALDLGDGNSGTGAFYLPFVWNDGSDAIEDPTYDAGETLVGVGGRMLLGFLRPDGDWIDGGWRVIEVDPFADAADQIRIHPEDTQVPVYLKGYKVNGTTEEFTMDIPVDGAGGLALVPAHHCGLVPGFGGAAIPPGTVDLGSLPMAGNLDSLPFTLDHMDIPLDHWLGTPWGFFADDLARERLYLYVDDSPADGHATPGEFVTHVGVATGDGEELSLAFLQGEMTWEDLWSWAQDECWLGFNLVVSHDETPAGIPGWTCHALDAAPSVTFVPQAEAL